ncbi:MAG: flippase [Clostridiales bacterium]|nr:flippase [Clostridiales bacterium]
MASIFQNRVTRNTAWIVVCKAVQAVIGLLISMVTTRYLGPTRYGMINYAASLVLFLGPIGQLGFSATLVHELIRKPEDEGKILGTSIVMTLISSLLCVMGISVFVHLTDADSPITVLVCKLYSLLLMAQSLELIQYWFQAKLLSRIASLVTLGAYVLISGFQLIVLLMHDNLGLYAVSKALEHTLIALVLVVFYLRMGGKKLAVSLTKAKELLHNSWPFILSSLMVMALGQSDRIMLKNMLGDTPTGYYSAAVLCANLTDFVFFALIDSMRPVIFEAKQKDRSQYENGISTLYSMMIYLALIQSVAITLFARPMVYIVCGQAYEGSVRTLQIIVWYTAFSYIGSARNVWIMAEGKQNLLWFINLCGAVGNILLNLLMIPVWGIEGAAVASLITQIFVNVIMGFWLRPLRDNNLLLLNGTNPRLITSFLRGKI